MWTSPASLSVLFISTFASQHRTHENACMCICTHTLTLYLFIHLDVKYIPCFLICWPEKGMRAASHWQISVLRWIYNHLHIRKGNTMLLLWGLRYLKRIRQRRYSMMVEKSWVLWLQGLAGASDSIPRVDFLSCRALSEKLSPEQWLDCECILTELLNINSPHGTYAMLVSSSQVCSILNHVDISTDGQMSDSNTNGQ